MLAISSSTRVKTGDHSAVISGRFRGSADKAVTGIARRPLSSAHVDRGCHPALAERGEPGSERAPHDRRHPGELRLCNRQPPVKCALLFALSCLFCAGSFVDARHWWERALPCPWKTGTLWILMSVLFNVPVKLETL